MDNESCASVMKHIAVKMIENIKIIICIIILILCFLGSILYTIESWKHPEMTDRQILIYLYQNLLKPNATR